MKATARRTTEVIVGRDGAVRAVYSPGVAQLASGLAAGLGSTTIRRASHVEPTGELSPTVLASLHDQWRRSPSRAAVTRDFATFRQWLHQTYPMAWWADMTPVSGPVLGPYATREEALAEEQDWLHDFAIPVPAGT